MSINGSIPITRFPGAEEMNQDLIIDGQLVNKAARVHSADIISRGWGRGTPI